MEVGGGGKERKAMGEEGRREGETQQRRIWQGGRRVRESGRRKKEVGEDCGETEEGEGGGEGRGNGRGVYREWKIGRQTQQWKQNQTKNNRKSENECSV